MTDVEHDPTPDEALGGSHMASADDDSDDRRRDDAVDLRDPDYSAEDDMTNVPEPDEATDVAPADDPTDLAGPDAVDVAETDEATEDTEPDYSTGDPDEDDVSDVAPADDPTDFDEPDDSLDVSDPDEVTETESYDSLDVSDPDEVTETESYDSLDVADPDEATETAESYDSVETAAPGGFAEAAEPDEATETESYDSLDVADPDEQVDVAEPDDEGGDAEVGPTDVPAEGIEPDDLVPVAVATSAVEATEVTAAVDDAGGEGTAGDEDSAPAPDQDTRWTDRWKEIQIGFVDEPRQAIESADVLVGEALDELTAALAAERAQLGSEWTSESEPSTEDLRLAFQRYRAFFDRLLAT